MHEKALDGLVTTEEVKEEHAESGESKGKDEKEIAESASDSESKEVINKKSETEDGSKSKENVSEDKPSDNDKNKKKKSASAGIIIGSYPLREGQIVTAKKFGINIKGRPSSISTKLLKQVEIIIITADNVPKEIFKYKGKYLQKIIIWKIKDVKTGKDMKDNKRIINIYQ